MGILGWFGWDNARPSRRAGGSRRRSFAPRVDGLERKALLSTASITEPTLNLGPTATSFGTGTPFPALPLAPSLPLFNPALGTLVDVRVTSTNTGITGQVQAENTSTSSGAAITGVLEGSGGPSTPATFEVDGLNAPIAGSGEPTTNTFNATTFDGTLDYAGTSGVTFPPLSVMNNQTITYTDPASLAFYTASAARPSVTPTMSAQARATGFASGGNVQFNTMTTAQAHITVTYDYTPSSVPIRIQRYGVHAQPTTLVVTLSAPTDPATAQNVNNYKITSPGLDRRFGTYDDLTIPITSATYNATNNTVTLTPVVNLNIHQPYELSVQFPGQSTPTVTRFNYASLAGFNYHRGRFFPVVNGHVVR